MGNLNEFRPVNTPAPSTDTEASSIEFGQPEHQEHNEAVTASSEATTSNATGVIQDYYKGEIQSDTLTTYRKKWIKSDSSKKSNEDTGEDGEPKKKRKKSINHSLIVAGIGASTVRVVILVCTLPVGDSSDFSTGCSTLVTLP